MRRFRGWLREHATPQEVLPAVVGIGLLAYVASLASTRRSGGDLLHVLQQTWVIVLVLTFPYLLARALVWYRLLTQLCIRVPWRQAAVSFSGGEMTKSLPGGVYVENYLLSRLVHFGRHSLIRSSMATTAMLGLEALVALPLALIIGIPGERWVFWLLIGVVLAWIVILMIAWYLVHHFAHRPSNGKPSLLLQGVRIADEFLHAGRELLTVQTLLDCIPTALYMFVYIVDLFVILRALDVTTVTFVDAMAVYSVVVLAVILVPIPTEIGITEFTGLGALLAYGVPRDTAALAMLSLRLLGTGMTIVVAGVVLLLLRDELRSAESEPAKHDAVAESTSRP